MINAGSRSASSAGLSAYTTTVDQMADSGTVDIGYHFFAVNANTTATIAATVTNATEGVSAPGVFTVSRTGSTSAALRVYYGVGGSAGNGVDYQTLPGFIDIPLNNVSATIQVQPIDDTDIELLESVTLSLILTNTYFVGTPDHATVTIQDNDDLSAPGAIATLNAPMAIDYHPGNSSLIVSYNWPTGTPKNLKRIDSTGGQSDWSSLSGVGSSVGETKIGIVPLTAHNFNLGELYFGTGQAGKIGKITADGSSVNTDWATLTNSTQLAGDTNFPGGLYIDQTDVFGGDLVVVTHRDTGGTQGTGGGVWRVSASTNATRVAQLNDAAGNGIYLEGVLTLPNDSCKYGPWAGKILSCAETLNLLFAIDVNGNSTSFDLGLALPEALAVVVSDRNLFCLNFINLDRPHSTMLKIPKTLLTNFVGDIIVVEEQRPDLVVVHWDGVRFVTRHLSVSGATSLEPVAFAPIEATP